MSGHPKIPLPTAAAWDERGHVTQARLRQLFDYHEDGYLVRKTDGKPIGRGSITAGYPHMNVDGTKYRTHRLIFLWHHGWLPEWPDRVDHEDRHRANMRIENLKPATAKENSANMQPGGNARSSTGIAGVTKYWEHFRYKGKTYRTLSAAAAAAGAQE
jgi:hypothetical protein